MTPEEEQQRALWRQQKHLQLKEELMKDEGMLKFVKQANPRQHEEFISAYAAEKVKWLEWGPRMKEWLERDDLQWVNDAMKRLEEIQQKKLFDVQCLWRAEKIHIPEIKATHDFKYWEDNVLNCPFIEPITDGEAAMYLDYLNSSNFQYEQGFLDRWQDYDEIKEASNSSENRNFPDWYDFHNGRTGLSVYLLLPDVRGEKEDFYLSLWRNENRKKVEENKQRAEKGLPITDADGNVYDLKPALDHYKDGWLTWFVKTFEDRETQEMFKMYGGERPFDDLDEFLEDDLELLGKADRIVPAEGWYDWREAIHKTADGYRRQKIIEAFPVAFDRYKLNVELQLPFEERKPVFTLKDWYYDAVLRGRELNGEPRDFDF